MKNYKGGYKIIDLEGITTTFDGSIKGLHSAIKDSYEKPILVTNFVIGGKKMNGVFSPITMSGTSYVLTAYGYTITVSTADAITIAEIE